MAVRRGFVLAWVVIASVLPIACGGDTLPPPSNTGGAGAATSTGGITGQAAVGGKLGSGGAPATGGALAKGGNFATGGTFASGGLSVTGGSTAGGKAATGGSPSSGGVAGASAGGGSAGRAPGAGGDDSAGEGGSADAGAGGDGGAICSQTRSSRSARSAGFSGSYQGNYYPLYSTNCVTATDCASACVTAGGTQASCAASECIDSTPDYCLPPTYWFDFDQLLIEGNTPESSTWIIMVDNPYRDQLLVSNFQFEIPVGATVRGIRFSLNEAADSPDSIGDFSVKALKNGALVGLDRGRSTAWTTEFHYAEYGGERDLWGATWTVNEVNSSEFGVALTPLYLQAAGNARAYVDFVKAKVYYDCN